MSALGLRLTGIGWGLPTSERAWSLHPDEPIVLLYSTQVEPARLDFDPDFYNYGTLPLTLNRVGSLVVGAYGGEIKDPVAQMRRDHLVGRVLSALAGVGIVAVLGVFLLRRFGRIGGLLGTAAVAVAPGLVVHSRFQTVDMIATFFVTLALVAAAKAFEEEDPFRWSLWCGLWAGLAASTKYSGIVVLAALLPLLIPAASRGKTARAIGAATGVSLVAFFLTTPGALLHTQKFLRDFQYEMWHTSTGHGLVFAGTAPGPIYHLANLFQAFGLVLTLLGLAGLVGACRRKDPEQPWLIGMTIFAGLTFILIARAEVKFLRYVFPLIPVLAVGVAWMAREAQRKGGDKAAWRSVVMAGIIGVAGLGGGGLSDAARWTVAMTGADPRDEAAKELKRDAFSVGLASDPWFYTPPLYPEVGVPRGAPFSTREEARMAARPPVLRFVPENPDERLDFDTRLLDELDPEFVVFSSFETEGLDRLASASAVPTQFAGQVDRFKAFMARLKEGYGLHRIYGADGPEVHDLMYIRPRIWVWKRLNKE